jgi:vesicle coat complex subunit
MKLLPVTDVPVKKAIHHVLPRYANTKLQTHWSLKYIELNNYSLCKKHPQAAVLAVNSVLHDCSDPNPEIKCLGIHTLCSVPEFVEHVSGVLQNLLADSHPRVRLAAVNGCRQLHSHSSTAPSDYGLIDILYSLVRDTDPKVIFLKLEAEYIFECCISERCRLQPS